MLQFLEEPLQDAADLAALHAATQVPLALDESLDQAVSGLILSGSRAAPEALARLLAPGRGVAALVVKPSVVGGVQAALSLVRWGHAAGCKVRLFGCCVIQISLQCMLVSELPIACHSCLSWPCWQAVLTGAETSDAWARQP